MANQKKQRDNQLHFETVKNCDSEFFYKWVNQDDVYCARVMVGYNGSLTANYYKNGNHYASYQPFIIRNTDVEISEKEFNNLIGINEKY